MNDVKRAELKERLEKLRVPLKITESKERILDLNRRLADPEIWRDPESASQLAKELSRLEEKNSNFESVLEKLNRSDADLESLEKEISKLETESFLSGPHDQSPAVLSVHSGMGGTDSQDFAAMLLRMYLRLSERMGFKTNLIEHSFGEEAGIKKATLIIEGDHAFGWLKGEAGVHRLIRLSPFNAKNLRQTSFVLVDVIPEVEEREIEIKPEEIKFEAFRSSGHGGQSVNTTDSAVRITHLPTGISVSVQNERSQLQNRIIAERILKSKLARLNEAEQEEEKAALRGEVPDVNFGSQIRTYTLHPYTLVKDHRTGVETANTEKVLDGELEQFLEAELKLLK